MHRCNGILHSSFIKKFYLQSFQIIMKLRSPAQILATVITLQTLISELTALPRIHFGIKSHHRQMNMAKSLLTETSTRTYTESLEKLLQNKQPTTRSILKPLSPSIRSKRALSKF